MEDIKIDHELNKETEISAARQAEIDSIPAHKRCYTLGKSKDPKYADYRKASDGTIYVISGGSLKRVTPKETREEKKERKRALKARDK